MNNSKVIALMESGLLSSSSSSDSSGDDELYTILCNDVHSKPKVKNFVENVVHSFTDDEVGIAYLNIIFRDY